MSQVSMLHTRFRLIDVQSGKILAEAACEAESPEAIAQDIARQLTDRVQPVPAVALLPLRQVGSVQPEILARAGTLTDALARQLTALGWVSPIPTSKTREILNKNELSPLSIEFDPAPLRDRLDWQAILIGTVEQRSIFRLIPAESNQPQKTDSSPDGDGEADTQ